MDYREVSNDCSSSTSHDTSNHHLHRRRQEEIVVAVVRRRRGIGHGQPPLRCAATTTTPTATSLPPPLLRSTSRIRIVHRGDTSSSGSKNSTIRNIIHRSCGGNTTGFLCKFLFLVLFGSIMTTMPAPVVSFSMTTTSAFRSSRTSYNNNNNNAAYPQQLQQSDRATTTLVVTTKRVMVVRILDQEEDSLNKRSIESKLESVLFYGVNNGDGQMLVSVKEQMSFCSQGMVALEPSPYGIITALIEPLLRENYGSSNAWKEAMLEQGARVALRQLNLYNAESGVSATSQIRQMADHVVMILPESYQNEDFLAAADVGNTMSMFTVQWATSLSAFMHELAHNYGLTHSGLYSDVYGDITGYMGKSLPVSWTPQKCYNAIQHWQLGWYPDNRAYVPSTSSLEDQLPIRYEIAAFVDAKSTPLPVLLKIDSVTALQYNRAKSYNQGTEMHPDRIVISRDIGGSTSLLAGLDPSSNPYYSLYTNDNQEITIYVCEAVSSSVDSMMIAIGMATDDPDSEVLCNAPMAPSATSDNAAPGDATDGESTPPGSQEVPPDQENNWNDGVLYGPPQNTEVPTSSPLATTQRPEDEATTRTPESTVSPTSTQLRRTRAPTSSPPPQDSNIHEPNNSNSGGSGGDTSNRPTTVAPTTVPPALQSSQDYARITHQRMVIFASALVPVAVVVLFLAGFVFYRRRRKTKDQAHRLNGIECENDHERHNTHDDSTTTRESCGQQQAAQQQDNRLPTELVLDNSDWELPTNSLYHHERYHHHNYNSDGCCDSSGSHMSEYWTPEIRNAVALCLQEHEREAARQRYHRNKTSNKNKKRDSSFAKQRTIASGSTNGCP